MLEVLFYASMTVILMMGLALSWLVHKQQKLLKDYFALKEEKKVLENAKDSLQTGIQDLVEAEVARAQTNLRRASKQTQERAKAALASELKSKLDAEFAAARSEIEAYKKSKITEVDASIEKIIRQTSKKVLGQAIDTKTHQELVMSALEQAKKENFF